MAEIFSATVGTLTAAARTALHVVDFVQTPAQVEEAAAEIYACQKKLGELIELRKKHAALLAASPADEAVIEGTIATAWNDLKKAKRVLEPNRIVKEQVLSSAAASHGETQTQTCKKSPVGFGRRFRWKVAGRTGYRPHARAIQRNHTEVRDQINRLEQMVRLGPLEALARRTKDEEQRRQEEMERARDERDMKGLEYLEPVVVVVAVQEVKEVEGEEDVSRGSSSFLSSSNGGEDGDGECHDYLGVAGLLPSGGYTGSASVSSLQLPVEVSQDGGLGSSGLITGFMAEFMGLGEDN